MSRGHLCFLAVMSLVGFAPAPHAAPLPRPSPEKVRQELDALWLDLLSADELTAGRALLKLAAWPDDTVGYLKERLEPLQLTRERAKQLLADLGGANEKTARSAFAQLQYFDPRLVLGDQELRAALVDPATDRRLAEVLLDLPMHALGTGYWHWNSPDNKVYRFTQGPKIQNRDIAIAVKDLGTQGRKATWIRAIRAIALLEQIGTSEAKKLLESLATGHPDAAPTRAAQTALHRLRKRAPK
jgi:hypothetical protein